MIPSAPADQASEANVGRERSIRVMLVDDSALLRALIARWIGEEFGMTLVGSFADGRQAVDAVRQKAPDVILLDVEMPAMDGLEALPRLLLARPDAKVLMVSALTQRNAQTTFQALAQGAVDYLPKPVSAFGSVPSQEFRRDLMIKIRALGRIRHGPEPRAADRRAGPGPTDEAADRGNCSERCLRPLPASAPRIVAIGSSTGGPHALFRVLTPLRQDLLRVPVLVTQHMPPIFTGILAERLAQATGLPAKEGEDGEPLQPGWIYVAPGGRHMMVAPSDPPSLSINDDPPLNFHRPSVDLLLQSAAAAYGAGVIAVILSGMGSDGTKGAQTVAEKGGGVLVQDQASSVVWGMPGNVAMAGLASAELSPDGLAAMLRRLLRGARP
jgi:two-component system, chemotaxis family, protein-glutamate methylesterase/glutaminase